MIGHNSASRYNRVVRVYRFKMLVLTSLSKDIINLIITLSGATFSGLLFKLAGVPAPYLVGSMFGIWILSAVIKPLAKSFNIPRWFHIFVVLGLAVLIGAMFSPDTLGQMANWITTILVMLVASLVATAVGYYYLTRIAGYDPLLAIFCAIPGGQAEVLIMSRDLLEKDYVVALCHLVRVVTVFCSVPLFLALTMGKGVVQDSNVILSELRSIFDLSIVVIMQIIGLAIVGYGVARLLRVPIPYMMGPLLLSMVLHISGLVSIPRVSEFVFLAQITIGGAIGARLGKFQFKVLAGHLKNALVNVLLVMAVFLAAAYLVAAVTDVGLADVMLGFVPGGLYEVTLLSLIFGFDVAFVAVHHSSRMMFILFSLPLLTKLLGRDKKQ